MSIKIYLDDQNDDLTPEIRENNDVVTFDICACLPHNTSLRIDNPNTIYLIQTGLHIEIPPNHIGVIAIRHGLARTYGVSLVNGVCFLDSGFIGKITIPVQLSTNMLVRYSQEQTRNNQLIPHTSMLPKLIVRRGAPIAQMFIHKAVHPKEFLMDTYLLEKSEERQAIKTAASSKET